MKKKNVRNRLNNKYLTLSAESTKSTIYRNYLKSEHIFNNFDNRNINLSALIL